MNEKHLILSRFYQEIHMVNSSTRKSSTDRAYSILYSIIFGK